MGPLVYFMPPNSNQSHKKNHVAQFLNGNLYSGNIDLQGCYKMWKTGFEDQMIFTDFVHKLHGDCKIPDWAIEAVVRGEVWYFTK